MLIQIPQGIASIDMKIAFDITKMKPGCVLLQASLGCDPKVVSDFDASTWLVFPTPDLKVYEINEKQLEQLIHRVNQNRTK